MTKKISRYLDVAVPLPLRDTLTYRLPMGMPGSAEAGARALVPVGRRLLTGVILGSRTDPPPVPPDRIRNVKELLDEGPVVPSELMSLARWASRYYVSPPGTMLSSVLPPGIGRESRVMVSRGETVGSGEAPKPGDRELLSRIPDRGSIPLKRIGGMSSRVKRLARQGRIRLETFLGPAGVRARTRRRVFTVGGLSDALAECKRAPRQREILRRLNAAGEAGVLLEELNDRLGPSVEPVRALVRKGLARVENEPAPRKPHVIEAAPVSERRLTPEQDEAVRSVSESLDSRSYRPFLLMGVTGSGKTEVYLRCIEHCLSSGRNALYLVPEIGLTPLLARDLKARLGGRLAILHSSLGRGERFDEWSRILHGEAQIVLGARSAILAPLSDIGLIVVDEEQDGSYKQEEDPRYNARDLALVRGRASSAAVILGSATPSIESYQAASRGRYDLLRLPRRIMNRAMADVRIVDMRAERERTGKERVVSDALREAVSERLARDEQAIILLNRRGYAPYVLCTECGAREECRRCSLTLTFHRRAGLLKCHYCGYQRGRPAACCTCGSGALELGGVGTERLEEHLESVFPSARLARLDRDTARGRRGPAEILSAFEKGRYNLLVGTQMVAKGHDFPGVTLVGVLAADDVLALPDFRAAERTFQLLTQVAGRAGRGARTGEVIVQAFHCDHHAIRAAARQDYHAFYEKESRYRRIMKYPPYSHLANVIVQSARADTGVRRAHEVARALRDKVGEGMDVLGPSVAPIARLKNRYRYQLIVKADSRRRLSDTLNETADDLKSSGWGPSHDLILDIDPVSLI